MDSVRHLHLEGRLVATAEVVDSCRHDRDEWHQLCVFRADEGYAHVTMARHESYRATGAVERGVLDITVDHRVTSASSRTW